MSTGNVSELNSNSPVIPTTLGGSSISGNVTSPFLNDSIGTTAGFSLQPSFLMGSPMLAAPSVTSSQNVTLNQYFRVISQGNASLLNTLNTYDNATRQANLKILADQGSWALTLSTMRAALNDLLGAQTTLFSTQVSQSSAFNGNFVNTYNNFLNSVVNTFASNMNQIQQQYAAGTISQATYAAAVAQYNQNVGQINTQLQAQYNTYSSGVSSYNKQVTTNNNQVDTLNGIFQDLAPGAQLPEQSPAKLASLQLLPTNLSSNPSISSLPTVPSSVPAATPADTPASTTPIEITLPNVSPEEQLVIDDVQNAIDTVNGTITAYNTAEATSNTQIATMEQAISQFAQGTITQAQYNTAVSTYLTYANTANTQLSSLVSDYINSLNNYNNNLGNLNAEIDAVNATLTPGQQIPDQLPLGVPTDTSNLLLPINIPSGPSPPAANPFASFSGVITPLATTGSITPAMTVAQYLADYYQNVFSITLQEKQSYDGVLKNDITQSNVHLELLPGSSLSKLTPNFSPDLQSTVPATEQGGGAAGIAGVGLTVLIAGISNNALGAIVNQQVLAASGQTLYGNVQTQVLNKVIAYALNVLQETHLVAAKKAGDLLSNFPSTVSSGSSAVSAVLAATLVGEISSLVNSGAVGNAITSFLTEAGLTPDKIAALQGPLTAGLIQGLLQFTVSQVANLLNIPGLLPQVLGNLPNVGASLQQQIIAAAQTQVNTVLSNQASVDTLKSILNDSILNSSIATTSDLNRSILNDQINSAIDATIANNEVINSISDFQDALASSLTQAGIDQDTVNQLTIQAGQFVKSEQSLTNLDDVIDNQRNLARSIQSSQTLHDIIVSTDNNSFQTNRQIRGALVNQLQNQGADLNTAYTTANGILHSQLILSQNNRAIQNQAALSSAVNSQLLLNASLSQGVSQSSTNQALINQTVEAINQTTADQIALNESLNAKAALNATLNPTIQANTTSSSSFASSQPTQQELVNALALGEQTQLQNLIQNTFLNAINATTVQNPDTIERYNTTLVAQLTSNGVDQNIAEQYKDTVAAINGHELLRGSLISDLYARDALRTSLVSDFLDTDNLKQALTNAALQQLQSIPNATLINQVATLLATSIIGPSGNNSSIIDQLDKAYVNSQVTSAEGTKDQQRQNYELFVNQDPANKTATSLGDFGERFRDTANAYIYSANTGIMYARRDPSNYKQKMELDILV